MTSNKKITIEGLTVMVQKGINELSEKLDQKPDREDIELKADKTDIDRILTRISLIGSQTSDNRADNLTMKV